MIDAAGGTANLDLFCSLVLRDRRLQKKLCEGASRQEFVQGVIAAAEAQGLRLSEADVSARIGENRRRDFDLLSTR